VLDVAVVGGGQAGLGIGYCLQQAGHTFVILERGRVGETWRSQRWDSFAVNTPNWSNGLPGLPYDGDEPDGFWHRDELVAYFELTPPALAGLTSPFGLCPFGSLTIPITNEMIHMWTLPGAPERFGHLEEDWLDSYLAALDRGPVPAPIRIGALQGRRCSPIRVRGRSWPRGLLEERDRPQVPAPSEPPPGTIDHQA